MQVFRILNTWRIVDQLNVVFSLELSTFVLNMLGLSVSAFSEALSSVTVVSEFMVFEELLFHFHPFIIASFDVTVLFTFVVDAAFALSID